jgi:uncharacterized membrane protein
MKPLVRAAFAGVASGARSFIAVTAVSRTAGGPGRTERLLHRRGVQRSLRSSAAFELLGDKLPVTPPRTDPPSLAGRVAFGALSGGLVASRGGGRALAGAAVGAATSAAWTLAGPRYRSLAAARTGSDLPGALAEDAAAVTLAWAAARR